MLENNLFYPQSNVSFCFMFIQIYCLFQREKKKQERSRTCYLKTEQFYRYKKRRNKQSNMKDIYILKISHFYIFYPSFLHNHNYHDIWMTWFTFLNAQNHPKQDQSTTISWFFFYRISIFLEYSMQKPSLWKKIRVIFIHCSGRIRGFILLLSVFVRKWMTGVRTCLLRCCSLAC